jgi:hypothetical protein
VAFAQARREEDAMSDSEESEDELRKTPDPEAESAADERASFDDETDDDAEQDDDEPAESGREGSKATKSAAQTREPARGVWEFLKDSYATADPRSLGLFRIALAALLFVDVARRWPDIEAHYANTGWLTNHFMLFRPMSDHLFSVYLAFSSPGEVKFLMAVQLAICVLFALGWHTRIMHVLSAILIVSVGSRNIMLENGGWVVLNLLTVWTMFLPLGRRFSIDALLASLKARRETGVEQLNDRTTPPRDVRPVVSLAVAALILQWVVIYYFNVVHKQGREWRDGTAVYYFFQQDRMVTDLGAWLRAILPLGAFKVMTYSALLIEASIAVLLALPFRAPYARMIAWALCILLHLSIDAVVQLGPFSWAMVTAFWVLIPRQAWEQLGPRFAARYPRRVLCLNSTSGFWLTFGSVIKRFDVLEKIEFRGVAPTAAALAVEVAKPEASEDEADDEEADDHDSDDDEGEAEADDRSADDEVEARVRKQAVPPRAEPQGGLVGEVQRTLVVLDPNTNREYQGLAALFRLFDAVPFGWLLVLPARIPGISGFVARRLARAARHSRDADRFFEVDKLPGAPPALPPETTPARRSVDQALGYLREGAVLALMIACGSQVLVENRAVPKWLKPEHRPEWMVALVIYPRLFQGWSMFAPSPPRDDGRVVVDGVTKDGRRLDPLTGREPSFEVQPKEGFRMNQIWGDFHRRIGEERFGGYLDGVRDMLKNYHQITGRPQDELKSFQVWFVNEQIPPPGGKRTPPTRKKILDWSGDPAPAPARRRSPGRSQP